MDPVVQAFGRSRGGWGTKVHLVVDGHGIPLAATVTAGQAHESKQVAAILEAVRLPNGRGRPTYWPKRFFGTLRARLSRLVRKTYAFSKRVARHLEAIHLFLTAHNLRIKRTTIG